MLRATNIIVLFTYLWGVKSFPQDSVFGIVGGHSVDISEVPFMARYCSPMLERCCGATILSDTYILTSAFCYNQFERYGPTIVTVGTDKRVGGGESYEIEEIYPHPAFFPPYPKIVNDHIVVIFSGYDVMMLKLAKKLEFSKNVQPIQLVDASLNLSSGDMLDAMGFGMTTNTIIKKQFPRQLQKVSVPYFTKEKCRNLLQPSLLPESMICTGAQWKGSNSQDEGGPLVHNNKLVGVISSTFGDGTEFGVTVHTYIPDVRDFIDSVLDKDKTESPSSEISESEVM